MSDELFRANAVKQQGAQLEGMILIAKSPGSTYLSVILLISLILITVFVTVSTYNRKETVPGYLQPDAGLSKVVAARSGVVSKLYVEDGQRVKVGDKLLIISIADRLSAGESLVDTVSKSIEQQIALISSQKMQQAIQFTQQQRELSSRVLIINRLILNIESQRSSLERRMNLNQARYEDFLALKDRGAISEVELQEQLERLLDYKQQLAALNVSEQGQRELLEQLDGQLKRLPAEHQLRMASLESEALRLTQQKSELDARGEVLLTAPISGRVTNLVVDSGQNIPSGAPLLTLMPENAKFKAVMLVPTRAYGFVKEGQRVRLRYDAFPYQRFGLYEGKVAKTGQAIVLPGEVDVPLSVKEPVYRIEVALDSQHIKAYGASIPLQSGMLLNGDLILEERTLISWIFDPILSLKGRL